MRRASIVLACVLLLAIAGAPAIRARLRPAQEPRDTVYAMLDAARAGDVDRYLTAFTGDARRTIANATDSTFSNYLRQTAESLKGVAVSEPEAIAEGEVSVRVEYIYQDRNEVQNVTLHREGSAWRISRLDNDQRVRTLIPYGTPIR